MSEEEIQLPSETEAPPLPEVDVSPDPLLAANAHLKPYVLFDPATGAIQSFGTMTAEALDFMETLPNYHVARGQGRIATHWVKDGQITPKTRANIQVSGNRLTNLPKPCTLDIDGTKYEIEDGEAELDLPFSGTYKLTVTSVQRLPWQHDLTYEANA